MKKLIEDSGKFYKPKLRPPESTPEVQHRTLPSYPEVALADEVVCAARLLYHILKDGSVTLVRLEWDEPPPSEYQAVFEESIQNAIVGYAKHVCVGDLL